jgi:xylulokinase
MGGYLAGVDVGTSGARCSVFDLRGRRLATAGREYGSRYPQPGWVEQDPDLLIGQTMEACREAVVRAGISPAEIVSIGFSAQRSVTCPIDAAGRPVRWLISWQDARPAAQVARLREVIDEAEFYRISGVPLGTTWILSKLLWMREHEPALYERTCKFVQNQDLVLKAFGADDYYTDLCCMAFYGLWDVGRRTWNQPLLDRLGFSPVQFGKPTPAGTPVGQIGAAVAAKTGFAVGTPVCVGAGDQNCSVVGMGAIRPGMGTVTLGTAGLAILCVDQAVSGFGGMLITNHAGHGRWEIEGLSNAAASSLRWFRDVIGTHEREQETAGGPNAYQALDALAASAPPGSKGLLYLPYLATAATPRWNPDARGAFLGLSFAHGRGELTRAVMEGVVLEIRDMLEAWLHAGLRVDVLRIGGGATRSRLWCQIQADVYGRPVELLACDDSTGLGSALLGGLGAGVFPSLEEGVAAMVQPAGLIEPNAQCQRRYSDLYAAYVRAYEGLQQSGTFSCLADLQRSPADSP